MTKKDDWTIVPRKGLGQLEFGMSPGQVDAWTRTYGVVKGRGSDRASDDLLRDTLEKFGGSMSEEEKQSFMAVYAHSGPTVESATEVRGDPGVVLRYEGDRLVEIMPAIGQRPVFLRGRDLFELNSVEVLALLERLNRGPGRYADTEAAFDNLAISTEGFCIAHPMTGIRYLGETDESFQN